MGSRIRNKKKRLRLLFLIKKLVLFGRNKKNSLRARSWTAHKKKEKKLKKSFL